MKYICLGYYDEAAWEAIPEADRMAFMDECLAYDAELKEKGHVVGGEALGSSREAAILRWDNGKVAVTDGPFTETKEQLGGFFVLEAADMNEAIRLVSKHPGVKGGPFEIRPIEDMSALVADSARRRAHAKNGA